MTRLPQVLVNVPDVDKAGSGDPGLQAEVARAEQNWETLDGCCYGRAALNPLVVSWWKPSTPNRRRRWPNPGRSGSSDAAVVRGCEVAHNFPALYVGW